ncbi:unnamed protein product [Amaranthus hypochondriacus]
MASNGFVVISMALLLFLVTTTTTCHARLLKEVTDNSLVEVRKSQPDLLHLSTQLFKISDTKEQGPMVSGVEGEMKDKYKNLRALVLASLPKGSKKSSSGSSKMHNEFNS